MKSLSDVGLGRAVHSERSQDSALELWAVSLLCCTGCCCILVSKVCYSVLLFSVLVSGRNTIGWVTQVFSRAIRTVP